MDPNQSLQRAKVNQNSWKLALKKHIVNLEDNLAELYIIAGIKYIRVVVNDANEEAALFEEPKGLGKNEINTYEKVITEHYNDINRSVTTICNLISCDAEFDLTIPVVVLLRLAAKVGQLRWSDFTRKIPGTMAKKHIYNKTSISMIQTSLTMFRWISSTLATDILPFQALINDYHLNLLEWTRLSHLEKHDIQQYYWLRSLVFTGITWELAQFSLNVNYNPEQLKTLIGTELVDEVSRVPQQDDYAVEKYVHDALDCLEWLFIGYSKWLDAQVEFKLKSFILYTCLDIYRNFEKNTISLNCRRKLLRVLVTIANQPFATSTTELAWHIIEQASRLETDLEIVFLTRKAMEIGLAHRPSVILSKDHAALAVGFVGVAAELEAEHILENGSTKGFVKETVKDSVQELVEEATKGPFKESSQKQAAEPSSTSLKEPSIESVEGSAEKSLSVPVSKPSTTKTVKELVSQLVTKEAVKPASDLATETAAVPQPEPESAPVCPEVEKISFLFVDELAK